MTTEYRVEIDRHLDASPERVFAAFADAALIPRWLTPAPEISVSVSHLDFREGGTYRFVYHLPDGTDVIIGGAYRLIRPPSRLTFTWVIEPPDEHAGITSEVVVTIDPDGGGSRLVIRHEGWGRPDAAERHHGGWLGALDKLARALT